MNTTKRLRLASVAAIGLGIALPLSAQTTPGVSRPADNPPATLQTGRPLDADHILSSATEMPISKVNKASSLIGMDVRNPQNERLGEIKDFVLDLHSGKIAYAVLSVGGFLGIGDKYVAVPPSAFSAAPDQDKLVLNADKARIQNAPSFAKTSWPDLNSAAWRTESAYWLSDTTAQGTAGSTRVGVGTESVAPDKRTTEHYTTPLKSDRTDATTAHRDTFRGRITAINPETRTMTVQGPSGTREFKFVERPVITLKDSRNPGLVDLKVGYPVVVGFHEDNGLFMAHSVIRSDTPEVK